MKQLSTNWFVEGLQDFEYKKYLLLAYLQWVKLRFDNSELYPAFSELIQHYQNLIAFQETKGQLEGQFPRKITGLDPSQWQLIYESMVESDESLKDVEEIVEYSIPRVRHKLERGKSLYEFIDESISINAVGLLPLYRDEGYILLQRGANSPIKAYSYHLTVFESANEKFRGIHVQPVTTFDYSLTNTFETIKLNLIKTNRALPTPATFSVFSKLRLPEQTAVMPVAKRKFMRHLARFEA
ncbi:MAG: hypothetical protein AAF570_04545 [Bacteroidota bacterium]